MVQRDPTKLLNQLVVGHEHLYVQNAFFRYTIDAFAEFCFVIVEGLAASAGEKAEHQAEELRRLMSAPPSMLPGPKPFLDVLEDLKRDEEENGS